MARLTRATRSGLVVVVFLATALAGPPGVALAGDPTGAPGVSPASCDERYPEAGPAGVDLRLGCIVSQVVGLYTAGQSEPPPTLSAYVVGLLAISLAAVVVAALAVRLVRGAAGRRLAPAVPGAWWQCPACRSVNAAGASRCYSCGAPRAEDTILVTDASPATPQSFGRGKRG